MKFGSFEDKMIGERGEDDRAHFVGLSKDIDLLPKSGINTGSDAFCADTGDVLIFVDETKTWYKQ